MSRNKEENIDDKDENKNEGGNKNDKNFDKWKCSFVQ